MLIGSDLFNIKFTLNFFASSISFGPGAIAILYFDPYSLLRISINES